MHFSTPSVYSCTVLPWQHLCFSLQPKENKTYFMGRSGENSCLRILFGAEKINAAFIFVLFETRYWCNELSITYSYTNNVLLVHLEKSSSIFLLFLSHFRTRKGKKFLIGQKKKKKHRACILFQRDIYDVFCLWKKEKLEAQKFL